jgi:hypothetical protein
MLYGMSATITGKSGCLVVWQKFVVLLLLLLLLVVVVLVVVLVTVTVVLAKDRDGDVQAVCTITTEEP